MTARATSSSAPQVDIGTGEVTQTAVDFRRDGILPLCVDRYYASHARRAAPYLRAAGEETVSPFGLGWRIGWDHTARRTLHGYIYSPPHGDEIQLRSGLDGRVQHIGHRLELEGVDAQHMRLVEYARGRAPISYVFVATEKGAKWILEAIEYRASHRILLIRDTSGRVVRLEHTRARCALVLNYTNERVAYVDLHTHDGGNHFVVGYKYGPAGTLLEVHDRAGCAVAYAYDQDNRLVREDRRRGGVYSMTYDKEGRCTRVGGVNGYNARYFRYDPAARRTRVSNSLGESWTYDLDVGGRIALALSPLGREEAFVFDDAGLLERRVDSAGRVTAYFHDEHGHLYGLKNTNGTTYWEYDAWHRIVERINPHGQLIARYGDEHDLLSLGRPDALWSFAYNVHGERLAITDPKGATRSMVYDQWGNRTAESDLRGNYTQYEYDSWGRCTKTIHPLGGTEERSFDDHDRVTTSTFSGTLSRSHHDAEGVLVEDATGARNAFRHDAYGRMTEHRDSEGLVCSLRWGAEPNLLLGVTNGIGHEETFLYDADEKIIEVQTRDGRSLAAEYDGLGYSSVVVQDSQTPPSGLTGRLLSGRREQFDRDARGLVLRAASGELQRHFEYDHAGRLVRCVSDGIIVTRAYDEDGRCTDEAVQLQSATLDRTSLLSHLRLTLDVLGRPSRFSCSTAPEVALLWDENSCVSSVQVEDARVRYARDASGAETERSSPGMRLLVKRDRDGRETEWLYDLDGEAPARIQAAYGSRQRFPSHLTVTTSQGEQGALLRSDGRGRLRAVVFQGEGRTSRFFVYDSAGDWALHAQTIRGAELLPRLESAGWDRAPVILSHYADEVSHATTLPGGRIESVRTGNLTLRFRWDELGRAIEKTVGFESDEDVWRYEYDAWDALRRVQSPQAGAYTYRYDALGRLIERRCPRDTVTHLVWQEDRILHVLVDGALSETRVHHVGTGELLLQRFGDGSLDVRPNRLRELEELLGSASTGSSVEASASLPRIALGMTSSSPRRSDSSFYDSEARVAIGIRRCWDIETGYDLTWQRGEEGCVPISPVTHLDAAIVGVIEGGPARLIDEEPPSTTLDPLVPATKIVTAGTAI